MSIVEKYFRLTNTQCQMFSELPSLYAEWNAKINVISRKDMEEFPLHHVLHSLAIAKYCPFVDGTKIIDVGTGGGFPGIPLAIMFPNVDFLLVDSIGKKIHVVEEIVKSLGLKNVRTMNCRAESINEKFDFVVSRAVCAFPDFVKYTRKLVLPKSKNAVMNGIIYLKGGDFSSEIKPFGKSVAVFEITDFFDEKYFEEKKIIHLVI